VLARIGLSNNSMQRTALWPPLMLSVRLTPIVEPRYRGCETRVVGWARRCASIFGGEGGAGCGVNGGLHGTGRAAA
jgi:hypothetical protein